MKTESTAQATPGEDANAKFAQARRAYAGWLATQPEDAFAPATHAEILALYDKNCDPAGGSAELETNVVATGSISVPDLIARSEAIPSRKAALDRARVRRALAGAQFEAIRKMSAEDAIAELCKTPEGRAQYARISQRQPGSAYAVPRFDRGFSIEEVVLDIFDTPELRAEFDATKSELRAAKGLPEAEHDLLTSVAKAALFLLLEARKTLAGGLETECDLEVEWSKEDRLLIGRMDTVLDHYLARALLADI